MEVQEEAIGVVSARFADSLPPFPPPPRSRPDVTSRLTRCNSESPGSGVSCTLHTESSPYIRYTGPCFLIQLQYTYHLYTREEDAPPLFLLRQIEISFIKKTIIGFVYRLIFYYEYIFICILFSLSIKYRWVSKNFVKTSAKRFKFH